MVIDFLGRMAPVLNDVVPKMKKDQPVTFDFWDKVEKNQYKDDQEGVDRFVVGFVQTIKTKKNYLFD